MNPWFIFVEARQGSRSSNEKKHSEDVRDKSPILKKKPIQTFPGLKKSKGGSEELGFANKVS